MKASTCGFSEPPEDYSDLVRVIELVLEGDYWEISYERSGYSRDIRGFTQGWSKWWRLGEFSTFIKTRHFKVIDWLAINILKMTSPCNLGNSKPAMGYIWYLKREVNLELIATNMDLSGPEG